MIGPRSTHIPLLALLAGALPAQNRVVLPQGYENLEAGSSHSLPWGSGATWAPQGVRVQTVYDSIYFTAQGWTGPHVIQRLRWRADGRNNPVSTGGSYANVRIDVSTAAVDHRQLSSVFDSNHGGDRQTVFAGSVTLLPTGNQEPNDWYVDVLLTAPFVYDPGNGDLLIDVAVQSGWSGGTPARTDAEAGTLRTVPASMVMTRLSSTATVAEAVLHDLAQVVSIDFSGGQQAVAGTYGTGCAAPLGQPLDLRALSRPVTGTRFDLGVQNLPPETALGLFVLGLVQLQPGIDLAPLGAPGCRQYVGLGGSATDVFQPVGSAGVHGYPIPTGPALAGLPLFAQTAAVVPGANGLGLLTSNGVDAAIGTF